MGESDYNGNYLNMLLKQIKEKEEERERVRGRLSDLDESLQRLIIAYEVHSELAGSFDVVDEPERQKPVKNEPIPTQVMAILAQHSHGLDSSEIASQIGPGVKMASLVSILSRMRSSGAIDKNGKRFYLPEITTQSTFIKPDDAPLGPKSANTGGSME